MVIRLKRVDSTAYYEDFRALYVAQMAKHGVVTVPQLEGRNEQCDIAEIKREHGSEVSGWVRLRAEARGIHDCPGTCSAYQDGFKTGAPVCCVVTARWPPPT